MIFDCILYCTYVCMWIIHPILYEQDKVKGAVATESGAISNPKVLHLGLVWGEKREREMEEKG